VLAAGAAFALGGLIAASRPGAGGADSRTLATGDATGPGVLPRGDATGPVATRTSPADPTPNAGSNGILPLVVSLTPRPPSSGPKSAGPIGGAQPGADGPVDRGAGAPAGSPAPGATADPNQIATVPVKPLEPRTTGAPGPT
jgi:hypothetical protein